ncbi:MAG: hydroxyisourate hydrolase [Pseudomonadota bacterium]
MGHISTHVLDAVNGKPGAKIAWSLFRVENDHAVSLGMGHTNADGRADHPLISGGDFIAGTYEIRFGVGDYFQNCENPPKDRFLDIVPIRFHIADPSQNYHIPLLVSHYSFSSYRGS